MIPLERAFDLYKDAFGVEPLNDRCDFLACLHRVCAALPKPCRVLEVGTYMGKSAFIMACAMHGTDSQLICIDPVFIEDRHVCTDAHHAWSGYHSNVSDVLCRLARHNLAQGVSIVPGFSEWVYSKWDGRSLQMVLVDSAHTGPQVTLDCRWSEHVTVGGFCLFDDWIEDVRDAAMAYFADKPNWELVHQSNAEMTEQWAITSFRRNS